MRPRTALWTITFVVVCGTVTTLLKTVERTVFGGGRRSQQTLETTHSGESSHDLLRGPRKPPLTSATDQHWEATKLLSEATVAHAQALECIERWQADIEPLVSDERGDAIAVNQDLVAKLAYVYEKKRRNMNADEIRIAGQQIERFQKRVETLAANTPPEALSPREMYEMRTLHGRAKSAKRNWEHVLKQANAIVLKAVRDVHPISEPTLGQSLEQLETDQTVEQIEISIDSSESPDQAAIPDFEEELYYEDKQRREQALSSEVRIALAPFIEPRSIQPSLAGSLSIRFSRTFEKRPMSLSKLMSIGALNGTELGLKKLALIGGNRKLPEPKWSIASQPTNWDDGDEEFLRQSQQMLRDYGAILVEEGLLSR